MARAATPGVAALIKAGVTHELLHFEAVTDLVDRTDRYRARAGVQDSGHRATRRVCGRGRAGAVAVVVEGRRLGVGAAKASMAEPADAERTTGYVVGGISPFGQRRKLRTVVDSSALTWDRVLCSAGKRHWDVAVPPADLVRLTDALTADIRA
ncbi:ybaK / prolyl-tRNA synthetases associated domain protein [Mycobacterium ulcerans str. Harvey]|uniref:YbaK / prolyl-tRNA synthetases associated domain protein n=1 Tax=Mycobacterium ulcerans str. Harvey TaxID=1299332 RepID=A0ABN0QXK1_MYCUL|nr:ybaK / prolyl-tRNA synthetases associated domain protein [Mycobacterium ulcerans str. Harvey]